VIGRSTFIEAAMAALGAALTVGVIVGVVSPASAQDTPTTDTAADVIAGIDDLEPGGLGPLIPRTFDGEDDVDLAERRYDALVDALERVTTTSNFADGSEFTGPCGGWAFSYDDDGELIDAALDTGTSAPPVDLVDGGQAFTSDNPYEIDPDGVVAYYGFAPADGEGPRNLVWDVSASGINVDAGGDTNPTLANRMSGVLHLGDDIPFKMSARVHMDARIRSDNLATCLADGHVVFHGSGLSGPVGIGALLLVGGGLVGLLVHARPTIETRS
jgi:hypothetical protein